MLPVSNFSVVKYAKATSTWSKILYIFVNLYLAKLTILHQKMNNVGSNKPYSCFNVYHILIICKLHANYMLISTLQLQILQWQCHWSICSCKIDFIFSVTTFRGFTALPTQWAVWLALVKSQLLTEWSWTTTSEKGWRKIDFNTQYSQC